MTYLEMASELSLELPLYLRNVHVPHMLHPFRSEHIVGCEDFGFSEIGGDDPDSSRAVYVFAVSAILVSACNNDVSKEEQCMTGKYRPFSQTRSRALTTS